MRTPTPPEKAFAWWRDAIAGNAPPVHDGEPQCGFFKIRSAPRSKQWIPARIDLAQIIEHGELATDEFHICLVGDKVLDAEEMWTWLAKSPVTKAEFEEVKNAWRVHQANWSPEL